MSVLVAAPLAHAVIPMEIGGGAAVVQHSNTPWTLQKTGVFVPGTPPGTGTVNWSVTVTRGSSNTSLRAVGYVDLLNNTDQAVPIDSFVVNLQSNSGGDWATVSSDVADSTLGDAAASANVDPDITYEFIGTFTENAASGSLTFFDPANQPFLLNSPAQVVPAGQTRRIFFVAEYNANQLSLAANAPLQIEVIVSFGNNFDMPSLATLSSTVLPAPTTANATVTLLDSSVTTSGSVTTGPFVGLNEVLTNGGSFPLSITVAGGNDGGTICNTATLTSPATPMEIVVSGVTIPLAAIPGVNLSAMDCQTIPKKPEGPRPISSVINSCSQIVNYDASLFTSPSGTITSVTFVPVSGTTFPFGTSTVSFTATDSAGNTETGTLTVNVLDTEAPVITPISNITVSAPAGVCAMPVTFSTTATDCNLASLTYSHASGSNFPVGVTVVTVTATDTAGHISTSTFSITVKDVTAPAITSPLDDLTLQVDATHCYATFNYAPTAVDDCSGVASVVVSPASGSQFPAGTTTVVTVTATDSAGNVTTRTFTVTVGTCPGKLGNYVWHDANQNGIQDSGEAGINGVKVTLYTAGGVQIGTTTTAGGGYYLFSNLTPGDYYVIFDKTTLPAGYVLTSQNVGGDTTDSDANPTTGKSEGNATVVAGGYNDTVDAGAYLPLPPGMTLEKTATPTSVLPFQPVTYSYKVTNTGGTTLLNIVVKDDNGTPSYPGDDFIVGTIPSLAPGASITLTATVIPVVSTVAVVNGQSVPAGSIIVSTLPNGDIRATYLQAFNVNDNTYGTGCIGWPGNNHKFDHLVKSDQAEFRFYDKSGRVVLNFRLDYLSATSSVTVPGTGQVLNYPSGYGTKGPFGGDGVMISGNANHIVSFSTTITENLNAAANVPNKSMLIVNSPTSLVSGNVVVDSTKAPGGWNHINGYTVVVKAAAFGSSGFGSLSIPSQHNSPSKYGCEELCPKPTHSTVTNTATATSGSLTVSDTATVTIGNCPPPPTSSSGKIGSLVWCDKDCDGLQDAGEPGIGGVTVQLKNSNGTVIATDITDGDGVYEFTGLSAGTYTVVVVTPSGYSPTASQAGSNRSIDSNGSPATVTLSTNSSSDQTIDFGYKCSVVTAKPLLTYTQGGWGSEPRGNNPGALLKKYFSSVYPHGYVGIGTSSRYLAFTSADAIAKFLPQGGTAWKLSESDINPTTSSAGVLAGQLLAARLNVDFSAAGKTATGLGSKKVVSGPLAGKTVNEVIAIANSVIAGGSLPSGLSYSSLNDVLTDINENYNNGDNNGFLQ